MKIEVWFSFSIEMEIQPEQKDDYSFLARAAKPLLIKRINSDSITENIETIVEEDEHLF